MKRSPIAAVVLLIGAGVVWVCPVRSRPPLGGRSHSPEARATSNGIALRMGCMEERENAFQCMEVAPRVVGPSARQENSAESPRKLEVRGSPLPHAVAASSARLVKMKVTAYCLCRICCEKWSGGGKTSIGDDAKIYDGVAADPKLLPYRTRLEIPGIGIKEVDDTGGGMRKSAREGVTHIDVRMPSHSEARRFGVKFLEVKILK